jgi:hypothetical protein
MVDSVTVQKKIPPGSSWSRNKSLTKSQDTLFHKAGDDFSSPPCEINSNGSTPTPGGEFTALDLLMDFLRVHQMSSKKLR